MAVLVQHSVWLCSEPSSLSPRAAQGMQPPHPTASAPSRGWVWGSEGDGAGSTRCPSAFFCRKKCFPFSLRFMGSCVNSTRP